MKHKKLEIHKYIKKPLKSYREEKPKREYIRTSYNPEIIKIQNRLKEHDIEEAQNLVKEQKLLKEHNSVK